MSVWLAPRVEAKLLQELGIKKTDKVLEIGTGSGYMAALLAARADHVVTVECRAELAEFARENIQRAGITNITIETGCGAKGWSQRGPYDAIVVSAAVPVVPEALLKQLRVGGRLAIVVGEAPVMDHHNFCISRVKRSCIHFVTPNGQIIPFETYNMFYRDAAARKRMAVSRGQA